jgi:hypothetical protein
MRRSARTDLCGGRSVMIVPTASTGQGPEKYSIDESLAQGNNRTMVAQEERFVRWEPIHGLPSNLDTPSLINDYDGGFRLTLVEERAEGRQFIVAFEQPLCVSVCQRELPSKINRVPPASIAMANFQSPGLEVGRVVPRPDIRNLPRLAGRTLCIRRRGRCRGPLSSPAHMY